MRPPSGLLRYMLKACVAQILLEKSYLNVENFLCALGARKGRGRHGAMTPLWPCNKVPKSNFQSIISQTNNNCSLLSLILAKLLLLHISCENIFALSIPGVCNLFHWGATFENFNYVEGQSPSNMYKIIKC